MNTEQNVGRMEKMEKVLVIDDDDIYLYVIERLLKKLNKMVEVKTAANGKDALIVLKQDAVRGQVPHLIITDNDMPVLDDISFIKEVQRLSLVDFSNTKVVLNSNSLLYKSIDRTGVSTSVCFIPKPLTREKLLSILV